MEAIVSNACRDVPISAGRQCAISATLRESFVLTPADILDITDAQFVTLGIPVGIANRLRRASREHIEIQPPGASLQVGSNVEGREQATWPCLRAAACFLREVAPGLTAVPREVKLHEAPTVLAPVGCLRWSQQSINSQMTFLHGHHSGSIYKMLDDLLRGHTCAQDLEIVIVKHNDDAKIFSEGNRRLVALLAYQSMQRHCSIDVRCVIRPDDETFRKRFSSTVDGWGVVVNASAVSAHRGIPLFDGGLVAHAHVRKLADKHPNLVGVLETVSSRWSADVASEHSLTIASAPAAKRARVENEAQVLLVYTPPASAFSERRKQRELWIFSQGLRRWSPMNPPPMSLEPGEQANPKNPRHIRKVWLPESAVFCCAPMQGAVFVITASGAWCCQDGIHWKELIKQRPPRPLNHRSIVVPLADSDTSALLLTEELQVDGPQELSTHALQNCGWMPFRFDSITACSEEGDKGNGWIQCDKKHLRCVTRAVAAPGAVYLLCACLLRIRTSRSRQLERYCGPSPHDVSLFQGDLFAVGLVANGLTSNANSSALESAALKNSLLYLRRFPSTGDPEAYPLPIGVGPSIFRSTWLRTFRCAVICHSLDIGVFVFCFALSIAPADRTAFDAGWVYSSSGVVRGLPSEALELPCAAICNALHGDARGIRVVGAGRTLLLVTPSGCAMFDAHTERWSDAPLLPAAFECEAHHSFAGNESKVWQPTVSTLHEDFIDSTLHEDFIEQEGEIPDGTPDEFIDFYRETTLSAEWMSQPDAQKRKELDAQLEAYRARP